MSCRPVRGRSSTRRVGVDQRRVLLLDQHRHHRAAVLEFDLRDVADLDPGDVHRLALARGDRLGGRQLGLELEALVAEDRDPGRVGLLLLAENVNGDQQAGDQQRRDRDEVAQVFADRPSHGATVAGCGATDVAGQAGAGLAVDVRQRVRRAGHVGAVRRDRGGERRPRAQVLALVVAEHGRVAEAAGRIRGAAEDAAAAGVRAQVDPVAVEVAAGAGLVDERREELLEVGQPAREAGRALAERVGAVVVVDDDVSGRDEVLRDAVAERLAGAEQLLRSHGDLGQRRGRLLQQVDEPAELGLREQRPRLIEPRVRRLDRPRELVERGRELDRQRPDRRQRVGERAQRRLRLLDRRRELGDRLAQVRRLGGQRAGEDVEVRDQVLELGTRGPRASRTPPSGRRSDPRGRAGPRRAAPR